MNIAGGETNAGVWLMTHAYKLAPIAETALEQFSAFKPLQQH
jgi:hypothetical protein